MSRLILRLKKLVHLKKVEFSITVLDLDEYRYYLHQLYWKIKLPLLKIKHHKVWCRIKKEHKWEEHHLPHWRRCIRCEYRELDHSEIIHTVGCGKKPEWKETSYGTPEWDEI